MPHVCSGGSEWPYSEQSLCSSVCPSNFTYFLSCTWSNLAHTSLTERLWVKDVHWSKSSFLVIAILIRRILDRTIHSLPLANHTHTLLTESLFVTAVQWPCAKFIGQKSRSSSLWKLFGLNILSPILQFCHILQLKSSFG